jgi:hypothetical protein
MGLLLKLQVGKRVNRLCVIFLVNFESTILRAIILITNRQVGVQRIVGLLYHRVWINYTIVVAKVVVV